jgi:protoheme IX farnesyltransferase
MTVKSIAGQLGERRARFALSYDSAHSLTEHWSVSDFVALTKPRVMMLAVFTALAGLSSAPVRLAPLPTLAAVLAIASGAGAAGVLNMWYDADIDAVMSRTAMRPIPRGKISRSEALVFGLVLAGFAVAGLGLATNLTAATGAWIGKGELNFAETNGEELHALAPNRIEAGFRYSLSYSVSDLKILEDHGL